MELDLKNGIPDGMVVTYYENGQKKNNQISKRESLLMASGLLGMKTVSLK